MIQRVLRNFGTTKVLYKIKDDSKRSIKFSYGLRNYKRSKSVINGWRSSKLWRCI